MALGGATGRTDIREPARTFRAWAALATLVTLAAVSCGTSQEKAGTAPSATTVAPADDAGIAATDGAEASEPASPEPASSEPAPAVESGGPADEQPVLPVTVVDETGAEITVESIERIIPLDGDVAEVVFALGLGPNVVATDLSATFPPEADALPEIGYQRAISAETVASYKPTVLLATDIAGPPEALDDLRRLGYPLVILPNEATPTGAGRKIRAVATTLGVPWRGEEMADSLDAAIAEAAVPPDPGTYERSRPRVMALYVRGTAAQLVLGETANTHWLIDAAGGVDVSSAMGVRDNAPISAEAILAAAPDVLVVPAAGLDSVGGLDGLLEIGGLGQTPAGVHRQVLAYDDQLLLGNGPRTAQMLMQLRDDLNDVIVTGTNEQADQEANR